MAEIMRPNSAARGYGSRWRKYRLAFLSRHPVCACGCGHGATDVDHIKPVDGPDDPLFWDPKNHQPLTHECHSRKTMAELKEKHTNHQADGPGFRANFR